MSRLRKLRQNRPVSGLFCRNYDDRGSTGAAELPFGFLWLVAVAMVVFTLASWAERHSAARAAADEAARAVVTADSWDAGVERAQEIVGEIESSYGLDADALVLELTGSLTRGGTVTAEVTMTVGAVSLPMDVEVGAMSYTVTHSEPVDRYRSL
ncbi:MAG TPA: hypothetical protein VK611_29440 [Acidimicrobiales bacterium]|nr:hypothetical protein [Acidimicrobiales bacterium]